jgi:AsmA protein
LFHKEIKVKYIEIDRLHVSIEKIKEGKFNFDLASIKMANEKKSKETKELNATVSHEMQFPLVNINKVKFSEARIVYDDHVLGTKIVAENVDIDIRDIQYDMAKQTKLQALSFKADATMKKLSYDAFSVHALSTNMHMKDANLVMENLAYTFLEAAFQGNGALDLSGKNPKLALKHKINNLKLAALTKAFWKKAFLEGDANGELKLACTLSDMATLKNTLNGFVHLDGKNITLKGYDIDVIATSLKDPQNLNIVQLINGNLGIAEGGSSLLQHIVMHTDLGYGEVKLSDVALSSAKLRIAAKGALNIIEEKLLDIKLAILDPKGCATFEQTIVGSFKKPALKVYESTINK